MNFRQTAFSLCLFLFLIHYPQRVAIAQSPEDAEFYSLLYEFFEEGQFEYILVLLDEYKNSSGTTVENPVSTVFRVASLFELGNYGDALTAITTYKRHHPQAEGEVHDEILKLERRLSIINSQVESLRRVVDSASARQFSQTHYGSYPSTPVSRMIELYTQKEALPRELQALRQKRYEAEVWIDGAEGPIYGGLAVGLGGWLILDLAEEREVRKASNYFLLAGGAIVAWGFYKLISSQNRYSELTEKIQSIETRLGKIDNDIYNAKLDILALLEN